MDIELFCEKYLIEIFENHKNFNYSISNDFLKLNIISSYNKLISDYFNTYNNKITFKFIEKDENSIIYLTKNSSIFYFFLNICIETMFFNKHNFLKLLNNYINNSNNFEELYNIGFIIIEYYDLECFEKFINKNEKIIFHDNLKQKKIVEFLSNFSNSRYNGSRSNNEFIYNYLSHSLSYNYDIAKYLCDNYNYLLIYYILFNSYYNILNVINQEDYDETKIFKSKSFDLINKINFNHITDVKNSKILNNNLKITHCKDFIDEYNIICSFLKLFNNHSNLSLYLLLKVIIYL